MEELHRIEPVLLNVAIYLAALVAGVLAFRRLGLGSALGYLLVGAIVGPAALGIVGENETVRTLAEFGVVLLLFVIGLELRVARLWRLRVDIFGMGAVQLLLTTVLLGTALHWAADWGWGPALIAGAALSLSSTAFGVQLLEERRAIGTPFADRAISVLLFQDLALVPLVALITLFAVAGFGGESGGTFSAGAITLALASLATLILVGYFVINPFFRLIARSGADEAFTAGALLVVIGAALLMQFAGLSMAMGAVVAGILLAGSEFRHRIESAIDPFRGLLLGMFFMGIGVEIDWLAVASSLHVALGSALGVFALKGAVLFALARVRGSTVPESIRIGVLLGQAGEFGFVLFGLAAASGVFSQEDASVLTGVAVLSMAFTPLVLRLADRWIGLYERKMGSKDVPDFNEAPQASVLVVGFGRFGQTVAQILNRRGYSLLLVDNNPQRVQVARSLGYEVFFGDFGHQGFIQTAAKRGLCAVFVCIDDAEACLKAVSELRERFPDVLLIARVRDRFAQWEMLEVGADSAVREVFESAVAFAEEGLKLLGESDAIEELIADFRKQDAEELVRMSAQYTRNEGLTEEQAKQDSVIEIRAEREGDDAKPPALEAIEGEMIPTRRTFPPSLRGIVSEVRKLRRKNN